MHSIRCSSASPAWWNANVASPARRHELRTPIAASPGPGPGHAGRHRRCAAGTAPEGTPAGCDRATRLVEQLLTLSRLEADGSAPHGQVDLGQPGAPRGGGTGAGQPAQAAGAGAGRGGRAAWSRATERCWPCWRATWSTTRSATPGGRADRGFGGARPPGHRACVEDRPWPGGPEHIAPWASAPFRVTGTEGTGGLGWSIMRRIAAAHGASLQAEASGRLGGLLARVVFAPAAPH